MKFIGIVAAFIALFEHQAGAESKPFAITTAADLVAACNSDSTISPDQRHEAAITCKAYLLGISTGIFATRYAEVRGARLCMPNDQTLSLDEIRRIIDNYIQQNPASKAGPSGVIASIAIIKRYECPQP